MGDRVSPQGNEDTGSDKVQGAPLTVHALNVLTGLPATGLVMQCSQLGGFDAPWTELMQSSTDSDGRLNLVSENFPRLVAATYKVRFETGAYWQQQGYTSFYPYVEVVFTVTEAEQKVHIPLLLSPYSYTTYRGS
ncbi:5-hydroxyisourate hydrolase-like [Tiliqua scincoides]|uniref:5-hydroxyisourate hydrolase-like n=1 Tax=Tiliqua scincoides TaxID=71010 RepID=UPI003462958C